MLYIVNKARQAASRRRLIIFQSNKTEFLRYYLRNALSCANKAKQNRAFASVTYKIRRADFPIRADWGEVLRQSFLYATSQLAAKRGENHSGAGWVFPLKT